MRTIELCNKALDEIADGNIDGAVGTISKLRAEIQHKVDEFDKWADEESKKEQSMSPPDYIDNDSGVEDFGQG